MSATWDRSGARTSLCGKVAPRRRNLAAADTFVLNETADAFPRVARRGYQVFLALPGIKRLDERSADTGEPFRLGADIRDGIEKLGHRLLLVHGIMMPRTCGHGHHTLGRVR